MKDIKLKSLAEIRKRRKYKKRIKKKYSRNRSQRRILIKE